MKKLLKSFNLFCDDERYWFVSDEEHVRGTWIASDYGSYVLIHTEVLSIDDDRCWYSNIEKIYDKLEVKDILSGLLKKRKELLVQIKLNKLNKDF